MTDNKTILSGKSREQVAFELADKLIYSSDGPMDEYTREDWIRHFAAAKEIVYQSSGSVRAAMEKLK